MNATTFSDAWAWVRSLLEPLPEKGYENDTDRGNRTFDVFCANCVANYDKIACIRAATVAFLGVLTAGIAIGRVFSLHATRRLSPLKLFLYYLLVMHLAAGSLEWIFGWMTQITLFISYAKSVELLIVCYFYLDVAVRMMQWNSAAGKSLTLGSLFLMFTFFTAFVVLGYLLTIEPWTDCHDRGYVSSHFIPLDCLSLEWLIFIFTMIAAHYLLLLFLPIHATLECYSGTALSTDSAGLEAMKLTVIHESSFFADASFSLTAIASTVTLPSNTEPIHTDRPTLLRVPHGTLCAVCGANRCNSKEWVRLELIPHSFLALTTRTTVATPSPTTTTTPVANATVAELPGEPPYWIWFSLGQLLTVQLMVSSFLIIIHRINRMSSAPRIRRSQRTQILCLLYCYEISAFADCAWHVSMFMLGDDKKGCSGIFHHNQLIYTAVKLPYDVASFLMPVWAILYVFRPSVKASSIMDDPESEDESMSGSSTHSTTNIIVVRNWQRRYRPLNTSRSEAGFRTRSDDRNFVDPSRQLRRNRRAGERGVGPPTVRRVASAPSIVPPTRRHSVSRSLISSPLYPIPEEPFITHSYQNRVSFDDDDDEGLPGSTMTGNSSIDNVSTSGLVDGER